MPEESKAGYRFTVHYSMWFFMTSISRWNLRSERACTSACLILFRLHCHCSSCSGVGGRAARALSVLFRISSSLMRDVTWFALIPSPASPSGCTIEHFLKDPRKMRRVCVDLLFPFNWWKPSGHTELCHFGLAMTARQANGSHLFDIGLFGDFILADCGGTRHDRST